MSITFSISVAAAAQAQPAAISARHLATFRAFGRETGQMIDNDDDGAFLAYGFEARVCPWSMASICALFDHDIGVIAVVEEAQFRGLNVRFWRDDRTGTIWMGVATSIDGEDAMGLSNANAFALLDALGLTRDSCGSISIGELADRVSEPSNQRRFSEESLDHYADQLSRFASHTRENDEVRLVWG